MFYVAKIKALQFSLLTFVGKNLLPTVNHFAACWDKDQACFAYRHLAPHKFDVTFPLTLFVFIQHLKKFKNKKLVNPFKSITSKKDAIFQSVFFLIFDYFLSCCSYSMFPSSGASSSPLMSGIGQACIVQSIHSILDQFISR